MPLDHYISQVHLRNFNSPSLGNRMYAIRKSDLKTFTAKSDDVCRIKNGSTNLFLNENRAIEDFLKTIEPNYNDSLNKLMSGNIDHECIYTIAGFIAYVSSCSPAGMRIHSGSILNYVKTTSEMMDNQGLLPPTPKELGGLSLTELIKNETVNIEIDPKFPQAIGIESILESTAMLGNFKWEILINGFENSPFFSSDYPVAIENIGESQIVNKIVPLSPNVAIRIIPDTNLDKNQTNLSFKNFRYTCHKINHDELVNINRLIVRCAEDVVFYRDEYPWIHPFVVKNRYFYIEPITQQIKSHSGTLLLTIYKIGTKGSWP